MIRSAYDDSSSSSGSSGSEWQAEMTCATGAEAVHNCSNCNCSASMTHNSAATATATATAATATATAAAPAMAKHELRIAVPAGRVTPCGRVALGAALQRGAHGEVRQGTVYLPNTTNNHNHNNNNNNINNSTAVLTQAVAVKIAHANTEARERLMMESRILSEMPQHANIVATFQDPQPIVCPATGDVYLPMELCDTDLLEFLLQQPVPRRLTVHIMLRLVEALAHCHAHGVFHLDVKPENILIDHAGLTPKLADFGMATRGSALTVGQYGSASYAAPEAWNYEDLDGAAFDAVKADVWSLGAVLFTLAMRRRPWEDVHLSDKDFAHYAKFGTFKRYRSDPVVDDRLMTLIFAMLSLDPSRRPSLAQVYAHLGGNPAQLVPAKAAPAAVVAAPATAAMPATATATATAATATATTENVHAAVAAASADKELERIHSVASVSSCALDFTTDTDSSETDEDVGDDDDDAADDDLAVEEGLKDMLLGDIQMPDAAAAAGLGH